MLIANKFFSANRDKTIEKDLNNDSTFYFFLKFYNIGMMLRSHHIYVSSTATISVEKLASFRRLAF